MLSPRAAVAGAVLGALLAAGNVYMGLRTGFWEIGVVTATVIAAAVLPALGKRLDPAEVTLVQSFATSTGAFPAAAGLLGAVPGMALLGAAPPMWAVTALGLGAGGLGIVLAHGLRRRLLEEEALPFPSGIAAAEVLERRAGAGASALGLSGLLSAGMTAVRNAGLFPAALLAGGQAGVLGLGVAVSPMLLGAGALIGIGTAGSLALGAGIAWLGLAPLLLHRGLVPDLGFASLASWLLWPGVGLMLGSAAASLARDVRLFGRGIADVGVVLRGVLHSRGRASVALLATGLVLVAAKGGFSLGLLAGALALGPSIVAAIACARVAGATDVAPAGEMGQVVQAGAGVAGAGAGGSTGAGGIAAGIACQAGISLWSLRAGARWVAPAVQARAQLAGLLVGAATAVPVYAVFIHVYGLGSAALPAPTALRWRALAELAGGGDLPPVAVWAAVASGLLGFAVDLARRGVVGRWLPSPGAVGLGFLVPAHYAGAMLAGALLAAAASRRASSRAIEPVAAGAIVGESVAALAWAALAAAGLAR